MDDSYVIVTDNDSHFYVVPTAKEDEWWEWCESEDAELGTVPDYADPVNGAPTRVKFTGYRIE